MPPKKQSPPPPPPKKEEPPKKSDAPGKPVVVKAYPPKASLGKRPSDLFFVFTYLGWALATFVMFFARCRTLLPETLNGIKFAGTVCDALVVLEGPLRPFIESQQQWSNKMLGSKGDLALEFASYTNVLFTAPLAIFLALGFLGGYQWVKNLALVHAAIMLYNMLIVDIHAYEILLKSDPLDIESSAFRGSVIYGFFTLFPVLAMKRVWGESPFSTTVTRPYFIKRFFYFIIKLVLFFWMVSTLIAVYEFSLDHSPSLQHLPSVVDVSKDTWEKAGPYREELAVHAGNFQVYAGAKLIEGAAATQAFMTDVGERVLKWAQEMQASNQPASGATDEAPKQAKSAPPPKPAKQRQSSPPPPPPQKPTPPPPSPPSPPKPPVEHKQPPVQPPPEEQKKDEL